MPNQVVTVKLHLDNRNQQVGEEVKAEGASSAMDAKKGGATDGIVVADPATLGSDLADECIDQVLTSGQKQAEAAKAAEDKAPVERQLRSSTRKRGRDED